MGLRSQAADKHGKTLDILLLQRQAHRPRKNRFENKGILQGREQDAKRLWLSNLDWDDEAEYPNDIVEQDRRIMKKRSHHMLDCKTFETASVALSGIEVASMIQKVQFRPGLCTFLEF